MSSSTLKQKISLFIFGIFLTFIILEIILRIGGALFTLSLEKHNRMALSNDEFRILCVGESTTAIGGEDSYPSQLEQILRERHPHMTIKVINKGQVSKTTTDLLAQLPNNLQKYRPHLVVMMTGINDRADPPSKYHWLYSIHSSLLRIRVYKLFSLLSEHIRHRIQEVKQSSQRI